MLERKTLYKGGFLELKSIEDKEKGMPPFEYTTNYRMEGKAVAVLPFRVVDGKYEFLLRRELNPAWNPNDLSVTSITGGVELGESPLFTAVHEMREEAGYAKLPFVSFVYLDTCRTSKSSDTVMYLYGINLTGIEQDMEPQGDGSYFEKVSKCEWMPYEELLTSGDSLLHTMYLRLISKPKYASDTSKQ